jgi:indoleacetamide hydrolase
MKYLSNEEIIKLTMTEALVYLDSFQLTSVRYTEVLIDQINKYDSKGNLNGINAMIYYNFDEALKLAHILDRLRSECKIIGPLHGIPILVKDSIDVKNIPTTAATQSLRINIPSTNAVIVESLVKAGAIVLGKTNLAEMSLAYTICNCSFSGIGKNPYNLEYICGGSSGGSAAAVSAYFAPGALGEDTVGSVRNPAMCCGVYGFRPTTKRYSYEGIVPLGSSFDTAGLLARSTVDIELMDSVIADDHEKVSINKSHLRIGIPVKFFYSDLTSDVKHGMEIALAKLENSGTKLIYKNIPMATDFSNDHTYLTTILTYEFKSDLTKYLKSHSDDPHNPLPPITAQYVVKQIQTPAIKTFAESLLHPQPYECLIQARLKHATQKKIFEEYFEKNNLDAIFVPSAANIALPLTIGINQAYDIYSKYYAVAPFVALPALSIPVGLTNNCLPIGAEIVGPHGHDRKVIAIGKIFEKILGKIMGPNLN